MSMYILQFVFQSYLFFPYFGIPCFQMLHPGNIESTDRLTSSCLVELSVVAAQGQDQIQEDMKNFAEQLKPYPFQTQHFVFHSMLFQCFSPPVVVLYVSLSASAALHQIL